MKDLSERGRRPEKSYFLSWQVLLGLFLIVTSVLLYMLRYVRDFPDVHHIFIYTVGNIAFVPIEVLLVPLQYLQDSACIFGQGCCYLTEVLKRYNPHSY